MPKQPAVIYSHPMMADLAMEVREFSTTSLITEGVIQWHRFPDNWPNLFIHDVKEKCSGRDVVFLGTLHSPEIIFEQISILYSLPRYMSRSVTFVLPYFPTATMERIDTEGAVATASTMARILSAIPLSARGPCQIIIFDIHALQERFYFCDSVVPRFETAMPLLLNEMETNHERFKNASITFPDDGAYKRFRGMFESKYPLITCDKMRDGDSRVVKIKEGKVEGRHCVIVDDLVMTGGTLIQCAKVLRRSGAASVSAFVTHAVFPKESWKLFTRDLFDNFYITDTVPHSREIAKHEPFRLLSIAQILSAIILEK